ncbi:MAG: sugar phosphate isomerase/epimerase family protein [Eubacteriales bacterium]|nr:sugar phosphate isomerase/epimerase family protein [Eubacteriales bacterium]
MKLSVQTGGLLGANTLEETFRLAAEAGFEGVDLNLFFDHTSASLQEFCAPVRAAMQKYGVKIVQAHAPFPYTPFSETDNEAVLRATEQAVRICGELGCPYLVVHPRPVREQPGCSQADEFAYNLQWYARLIPALEETGVVCCLENLMIDGRDGRLLTGPCMEPREALAYVDALNERAGKALFGFCLDIGHATVMGMDPAEYIRALGGCIRCLHVHDNDGRDDEHVFPFMGVTDWPRVCAALRESGYAGDLSFETFGIFRRYDRRLTQPLLALLAQTGRMLRDDILA